MNIIVLCIIVIIFILLLSTNIETFNVSEKIPSTNSVSLASRTLADHNSYINNINLEPATLIDNGYKGFMMQDFYDNKYMNVHKDNIDNLTYNALKDLLYETKKLFNYNKKYITFNEKQIANVNIDSTNYSFIIEHIFNIVKELCKNQYDIVLMQKKAKTYVDNNNIKYINFIISVKIIHPMDVEYNKKNLEMDINLTIIMDSKNITIKDLNIKN